MYEVKMSNLTDFEIGEYSSLIMSGVVTFGTYIYGNLTPIIEYFGCHNNYKHFFYTFHKEVTKKTWMGLRDIKVSVPVTQYTFTKSEIIMIMLLIQKEQQKYKDPLAEVERVRTYIEGMRD